MTTRSVDAAAQRQRVCRVGPEIPHGGEAPSRQHLLHMCGKRCGRRAAGVAPHGFREMDVAVPEAGNDGLSAAIDDDGILRNLNFSPAAGERLTNTSLAASPDAETVTVSVVSLPTLMLVGLEVTVTPMSEFVTAVEMDALRTSG